MSLSSTQIGAIGENILVNAIMIASQGKLSPFQPAADDDGLDVLFFDKEAGGSAAIQLKCRTASLRNPRTGVRGNAVHFEIRKATINENRQAYLVAALFNKSMTDFAVTWLIPLLELPEIAADRGSKYVIRPSNAVNSQDRFVKFRCLTSKELVDRIAAICNR